MDRFPAVHFISFLALSDHQQREESEVEGQTDDRVADKMQFFRTFHFFLQVNLLISFLLSVYYDN